MAKMTVNTDQVSAIADEIESLNTKLADELTNSQKLIADLGNSWTGEAYEATKTAYDSFASKFFETYQDVIKNYVAFLRKNVSEGYTEVETVNVNLGDAFK